MTGTRESDLTDGFKETKIGLIPVGWEVEEFIKGVDTLRNDVDRIEARVKRLQGKLKKEV